MRHHSMCFSNLSVSKLAAQLHKELTGRLVIKRHFWCTFYHWLFIWWILRWCGVERDSSRHVKCSFVQQLHTISTLNSRKIRQIISNHSSLSVSLTREKYLNYTNHERFVRVILGVDLDSSAHAHQVSSSAGCRGGSTGNVNQYTAGWRVRRSLWEPSDVWKVYKGLFRSIEARRVGKWRMEISVVEKNTLEVYR